METLNLSNGQRRFLVENFTDQLKNGNYAWWKQLGATCQSVMREAVYFTCLNKPIEADFKTEEYEQNGEQLTRTFVTIKIKLEQPGTGDKIVLERTFNKNLLDTQ